jgi:hypothetical protein
MNLTATLACTAALAACSNFARLDRAQVATQSSGPALATPTPSTVRGASPELVAANDVDCVKCAKSADGRERPAPVCLAGDWPSQGPLSQKTRDLKGRVQLAPETDHPGYKTSAHAQGSQGGPATRPDGNGCKDGTHAAAGRVIPAPLSVRIGAPASVVQYGEPDRSSSSHLSASAGPVGLSLQTARACFVEAGFSLPDCAAITWVIKRRAKRAGWTYERMLLAYSALDADTERAAFARQLPAGDEPTFSARENERWALLRAVARAALDGRIRSAARGATHWGSRTLSNDVRRAKRAIDAGRWRTIKSHTVNAFYAERGR